MGRIIAAAACVWILASQGKLLHSVSYTQWRPALFPAASASDGFTSLEVIKRPGPRVMYADSFTDQRVLWLFPYLNFSQSRTITGWAFRAQPSNPTRNPASPNMPVFQLWQERTDTPDTLDYHCINCSNADVGPVEQNFTDTNLVYKQTLGSPLVVTPNNHYLLGILLPSRQEDHLNLAFQNNENESAGRLSYFFNAYTALVSIKNETYRDNLHIPLVTPLYGKIAIPHGIMYSSMLHVFFSKDMPEEPTVPPVTTGTPTSSPPHTSAGLSACNPWKHG